MPQTTVNHITIQYRLAGSGPRLLYISGTGGDLRQSPNIFDSPLAQCFTILGYDQRGLGRSGKPQENYTMAAYAQDALGLARAVGWDDFLLMGWSFGAMVAQEAAILGKTRVRALVLASGASGGAGGDSYPLHEMFELPEEAKARRWMELADVRRNQAWQKANPDQFQQVLQLMLGYMGVGAGEPGRQEGAWRQLMARKDHDTWDRLGQIGAPTLVCGGLHDGITRPAAVKSLAGAIKGAKVALFDGGHAFWELDPTAWPTIQEFLLTTAVNPT